MAEAIQVNFGRPMPVFPLPSTVLLPHALQPLQIFEPRYRQMVNDCLDGSGQMAIACLAGTDWKSQYHRSPLLRPAVCVGQIMQHQSLDDGRHNILLQGICRAKITKMIEPANDRQYRLADLAPLEPMNLPPPPMSKIRRQLRTMLESPRLSRMRGVEAIMDWFERKDVSTHALLELIGFALFKESELKYRLLAEADPVRRARIIRTELTTIDHMVSRGDRQPYKSWPKGLSWN